MVGGPFTSGRLSALPRRRGLPWSTVYWFFTALLIAASAGTVGYACYLLRRLFSTTPAAVDVPPEPQP